MRLKNTGRFGVFSEVLAAPEYGQEAGFQLRITAVQKALWRGFGRAIKRLDHEDIESEQTRWIPRGGKPLTASVCVNPRRRSGLFFSASRGSIRLEGDAGFRIDLVGLVRSTAGVACRLPRGGPSSKSGPYDPR